MKIISRQRVEVTRYWTREFDLICGHGRGYSFPCNEHGTIAVDEMGPAAWESFRKVQYDPEYRDRGAVGHTRQTTHPAIGECDECKRLLALISGWANSCECGAEYNGFGQRLTKREEWGEETGEHWADLGNIR